MAFTFACCVHALVASQSQIQNCTNVQAGKKYSEERSDGGDRDYCAACGLQPVLCRRREVDGLRRGFPRDTGHRVGPWVAWGRQVTPRLGFQACPLLANAVASARHCLLRALFKPCQSLRLGAGILILFLTLASGNISKCSFLQPLTRDTRGSNCTGSAC